MQMVDGARKSSEADDAVMELAQWLDEVETDKRKN